MHSATSPNAAASSSAHASTSALPMGVPSGACVPMPPASASAPAAGAPDTTLRPPSSSSEDAFSSLSLEDYDDEESALDDADSCASSSSSHSPFTPPSTAPSLFSLAARKRPSAPVEEEEDRDHLGIDMPAALSHAHALLVAEARALVEAAARLEERPKAFENAVRTVVACIAGGGKLVWTGVGKSGLIARKLHATSLSLGLSSAYLCPVSALHGDLGALSGTWPLAPRPPLLRARAAEYRAPPAPAPDVLCALSHSGESAELLRLLPHAQARGCPILAFTARKDSSLGRAAAAKGAWVDCRTATPIDVSPQALNPVDAPRSSPVTHCACCSSSAALAGSGSVGDPSAEADALVPAPTSSTTVALAMGDALVLSVARACGLGVQSFKQNHPGGSLGVRLAAPVSVATPTAA